MRILWHSAAPWEPTGYGQQTDLWTRYLQGRGHDVTISAYHGLAGTVSDWHGMTVLPAPLAPNGPALLPYWAAQVKPDVVIMLADFWTYNPRIFAAMPPVLAWLPLDTDPMSAMDFLFLKQSGVTPVAMSRHCAGLLERAGWADPAYVPHGIDTSVFAPPADREALRLQLGFSDQFVVGMNFNNIDPVRKAAPQQMAAFARFHVKHPRSALMIHTQTPLEGSLNIEMLAVTLKIRDAISISDQHKMQAGTITAAEMAAWYGVCDVVMNATMGEGFGLPGIEAQACGTPVILSDNSTGRELIANGGLLVPCDPWWNHAHQSWWGVPQAKGLDTALRNAYAAFRATGARQAGKQGRIARQHALSWDVEAVGPLWDKVLSDRAA